MTQQILTHIHNKTDYIQFMIQAEIEHEEEAAEQRVETGINTLSDIEYPRYES